MRLRKITANVAYIKQLTSDDMTEHISCQVIAEYEVLLAFAPSLKAELAAIYELFFSSVVYSKPR